MDFYIFGKNQSMAENFSVQINIPVSDHIYKYLAAKCGTGLFTATRNTFVGSVVLSMLSRNEDLKRESSKKHSKVFTVLVKEDSYMRNGIFIDLKCMKAFNEMVDKMFREELYCHMIINKFTHKSQYLDCIRNFLRIYNINEEDIKEETVYRDFKRKKEDIESRMQLRINH